MAGHGVVVVFDVQDLLLQLARSQDLLVEDDLVHRVAAAKGAGDPPHGQV